MSAAIQAATACDVVGIDGPSVGFLRHLVGEGSRSDVDRDTVWTLASGVASATKHAIACRLGALFEGSARLRSAVDSSVEYDCEWSDPPEEQASDEQAQLRRSRAVKHVFGESTAVQVRDSAREAHMAEKITALRQQGSVVAVVGAGHLDPLADRLQDASKRQ
jgi:pheromone shutdown protein TraB